MRANGLKGRKTLVVYLTAGDPSSLILSSMLSFPRASICSSWEFQNEHPKYDGPTIRESYRRALKNGVTMEKAFEKGFPQTKSFSHILNWP